MNQEAPYILPLGIHWLELLTKNIHQMWGIVRRDGTQGFVKMNQEAPYILPLGVHWLELLTEKHKWD